jgi:hypothetical protein
MPKSSLCVAATVLLGLLPSAAALAQPTLLPSSFVRVRADNHFGVAKQHEIFPTFGGVFGDTITDTEMGTAASATNTATYDISLTGTTAVFDIQTQHTTSVGSTGNLTEGFLHFTLTEPYVYELTGHWSGAGTDAGEGYQQRSFLRQLVSPFATVYLEDETRFGTAAALYVNTFNDTGGGLFNQAGPRLGVLPPGTYEFMYELEDRDADNDQAGSGTSSGRVRLVLRKPVPPTNLQVATSGLSIVVSWAASGDALAYQFEAGSTAGAANLFVGDVGGLTQLQGPVPPGTYFVRVRSRYGSALGPPSNDVTFTVGNVACGAPPPAPTGHSVVAAGLNLALTWDSTVGATSYVLEAGDVSGAANLLSTNVGGLTTLSGVAPAMTYFTRVRAVNACGASPASNEAAFTLACTPPPPVAGLDFTRPAGLIGLSWRAAIGATSYAIQVGSSAGASDLFSGNIGAATSVSFPSSALPPGIYYLRVLAVGPCGTSVPSGDLAITLP